jgi:hypothetical protein
VLLRSLDGTVPTDESRELDCVVSMLKMKLVELPARGQAVSIFPLVSGDSSNPREGVCRLRDGGAFMGVRELRAALCIHNRIPPVIAVVQKVDSGPSRNTAEPERERTI